MTEKQKKEHINNLKLLANFNYLMNNVEAYRAATSDSTGQLGWRNHRENECIIELYCWLYTHVSLLRELYESVAKDSEIADIYEAHRLIQETHKRMVTFKLTANQAVLEQIKWEKSPENNRNKFK